VAYTTFRSTCDTNVNPTDSAKLSGADNQLTPTCITHFDFPNNATLFNVIKDSIIARESTPTGLTVTTSTSNSISLSWTAVSGASSYNVYRDGAKLNASAVTGTSYTDEGLGSGITYSYQISAIRSGSEGARSTAVAGTTTGTSAVPAPTNLAVGSLTGSSAVLSWSDAGASGYNLYRSTASGGPWIKLNGSPIINTTYTDIGLSNPITYYWIVRSIDAAGAESTNSNQVSAPPPVAYSQTITDTVVNHYVAGRVAVNQYITLGQRYGYNTTVALYECQGTWTDHSNCTPI
jgi:fibronectin type 3 domain-containing protein